MKIAIGILILALVGFGAFKLWEYWDATEQNKNKPDPIASLQPQKGIPHIYCWWEIVMNRLF